MGWLSRYNTFSNCGVLQGPSKYKGTKHGRLISAVSRKPFEGDSRGPQGYIAYALKFVKGPQE